MTERPRIAQREPRSLQPEQLGKFTVCTPAVPQRVNAWILWEDGVEELVQAHAIAWTHHRVLSFLAGSITFWANCTYRRVDGFTPSTPSTPNIQHTLGSATPISAFIWRCRCNIRHCRNSEMSSNGPPGTWETTELIGVLALGQFLVLSEDAHCHHVVQAVAPIPIRI